MADVTFESGTIASSIVHSLLPKFVKENVELTIFVAALSYALFAGSWIVNTDWLQKLHLFSGATCAFGGKRGISPS